MRRFQRLLLFFLAGLILVLSPTLDFHRSVFPAEVVETTPPTTQIQGVELPDLGKITFNTLPPIAESGSFSVPPEVVEALGYDPSRSWSAGQTAQEYLKLGDFQESFQLQKYNLETLATMGGASLESARLSDFELLNRQTIGDLITAVPGLSDRKIAEVPSIADLLSQSAAGAFNPTQTLGFLAQKSELAQLSLGGIDLSIYDLNSIPGIKFTPLETFREWQNTLLKGIPALKDIPWSQFLNPVTLSGGIGKVDVVLGSTEKNRVYTISGSYKEGFQVPCLQESCPHIEMAGLPLLKGRQWISGKAQKVKGGHGILGLVNGGKEPTGRHPFGNAFKVVLTATKEAEPKAEFGLYFRFCAKTKLVDLGCTPYIIGPIPWIPAKEKDWIFLGFLEGIDKKAEAFKKPPTVGTPPINGNPFVPGETSVPTTVQNLNTEQLNFDPNAVNFSDRTTVLQGSVVKGNQENIGFLGHVGGFFKGFWDAGVDTVKDISNKPKGAWNPAVGLIATLTGGLAISLAWQGKKLYNGGVINNARLAQKWYYSVFSDEGKFANRTIDELVDKLRSGKLRPEDVPIEYIERDGKKIILNTRSSAALEKTGIARNEWNVINKTRDLEANGRLNNQLTRNDLFNKDGSINWDKVNKLKTTKDLEHRPKIPKEIPKSLKTNTARRFARSAGKILAPMAIALDALQLRNSYKEDGNQIGQNFKSTAGNIAGGWIGGLAGAKAGAMVGGAIGSLIPVPVAGTAIGALAGGVIGGVGGAFVGSWIGENAAKRFWK